MGDLFLLPMMTFRLMKECFSNSNRHLRIASTDIRKHSFLKGVCTQDKTLDSVKQLVSNRNGRTFQEERTIILCPKIDVNRENFDC